MRHFRWESGVVAVMAFAIVLMVGSAAWSLSQDEKPAAVGKVSAYEAGKSISVEVGSEKKESFKIDDKTKLEGEIAVGNEVKVWAKEGTATRIVGKKK